MWIRSLRNEKRQRSTNDTSSPSPYQQQDVARLMDDPRYRRSVKQGDLSTSWDEEIGSGRIIMLSKQSGGMVTELVQRDILQVPRTCFAMHFAPEEPLMSKGPTNIGLGLSVTLAVTESGNVNKWHYRDVDRTWSFGASEQNPVVAVRLRCSATPTLDYGQSQNTILSRLISELECGIPQISRLVCPRTSALILISFPNPCLQHNGISESTLLQEEES